MNKEEAKEIHLLLLAFISIFHQKFLLKLRQHSHFHPRVKKNGVKIINILYHRDGLTPTELGKMLDIEKGSLTTILDQLADRGFIVREIDANDRRKLLVSLTQAGREQMDRCMSRYTDSLVDLFGDTGAEEMALFTSNLRSIVEFMKKL